MNDEINPFLFGTLAGGPQFNDREEVRNEIQSLIINGINCTLISPRRWGKTSLIHQVKWDMRQNKKVKFCMIDLFSVTDENEFFELFSKEIIRSTSNQVEEWIATTRKFLSKFSPQISLGVDPMNTFDLSIRYDDHTDTREILELPQKVAKEKEIRLVVCLDEFQNIDHITDGVAFQKKMRAAFQKHRDVVYLFYGSKRHMMNVMFSQRNMPFYKFGEVIFLEKIKLDRWESYLQNMFKRTGKKISKKLASQIALRMELHTYYVQQYAHHVWERTVDTVTEDLLEKAMEQMLHRNSLFFEREVSYLSPLQINLLKAIAAGNNSGLTRGNIIKKFRLSSSAAVTKALSALEKKDVIDRFTGIVEYVDPLFSLWIKRRFEVR